MNKETIERQMFTAQMKFMEYLVFHGHLKTTPEQAEKIVMSFLKETFGDMTFDQLKDIVKKSFQ